MNKSANIVLRIEGDLDTRSIAAFRDNAFTAIGLKPHLLIIDLTGAPFVDTAGLAALVTVARVAKLVKVPIGLRPAMHLRRVLHTSGLVRVLPIIDDLPEESEASEPNTE